MPDTCQCQKLLTRDEAAAVLGLRRQTLDLWGSERRGPPFIRCGTRTVRYRRSDLERWLDTQTVRPALEEAPA